MSSIFSTQKRHTFLRRKYCFFWVSTALSPPVGRWDALPGLPLDSAIIVSLSILGPLPYGRGSAGLSGTDNGSGVPNICAATDGCAGAGAAVAFRWARFSR